MTKQKESTSLPTKKTRTFGRPTRSVVPSTSELNTALNDVVDLMERALLPFIVLGQTAMDMVNKKELSGKAVEIGVMKKYITKEAKSTLMTFMGHRLIKQKYGYSYKADDVLVRIRIVKRDYAFFKHPDSVFYMSGEYKIPNPFNKYIKVKGLIQ